MNKRWRDIKAAFFKEIRTPAQKRDLLLFMLAMAFNIWWCALMAAEAFQLNVPGHTITFQATFLWLTVMTGYVGHKSFARWHGASLDGSRMGHTLGVMTLLFGLVIYTFYEFYPGVVIPEQLFWGLEGSAANLLGWQLIKSYHHRIKKNGNGDHDTDDKPHDAGHV